MYHPGTWYPHECPPRAHTHISLRHLPQHSCDPHLPALQYFTDNVYDRVLALVVAALKSPRLESPSADMDVLIIQTSASGRSCS